MGIHPIAFLPLKVERPDRADHIFCFWQMKRLSDCDMIKRQKPEISFSGFCLFYFSILLFSQITIRIEYLLITKLLSEQFIHRLSGLQP